METLAKILFMGVVIQILTFIGCLAHGAAPKNGAWGLGTRQSWIFSMTVSFFYVSLVVR